MDFKPNLLIIDDESDVGIFFKRLFESKGCHIEVATSGDEAKHCWTNKSFHVALVDLKLPDVDGLTLLQKIKEHQPGCEVIIMTGYATTKTAVKAIQLGAFDYIEKPFDDINEIERLIDKAVINCTSDNMEGSSRPTWADCADQVGLYYGRNKEMRQLLNIADKIARKNINVLIQGETGTGKEVLARFVHQASNRNNNEFIAINCGAVPENLLESQLFGHEKGAFTGATGNHRGIFELADNGTLFLDEIGEASLAIQVKLLRVLETGEFYRVGGEKPIRTNVRLIAATNVDLEKAVAEKKFREDLFYRLDVIRLTLPTLKQRHEDIPGLVHQFLKRLGIDQQEIHVSTEVMDQICNYSWPGNLRELMNTINQSVALCDGGTILPTHLPSKIQAQIVREFKETDINEVQKNTLMATSPVDTIKSVYQDINKNQTVSADELLNAYNMVIEIKENIKSSLTAQGISHPETPVALKDLEAKAIEDALAYFNGNVSAASKALGVGRNTLYRKVREYDIGVKG
ncbi:MAG: sigma-54-dependent Fis family transcriptional regulator [Firmicutes bacterium]|nr:sigma-54-dependent Fis family transcriptional regulator [Bacillota bacterium]